MSTNETTTTGYDDNGAMVYIISVLLWYSTGIIFMLAMQMKARSELVEEATRRRTKFLIRNMRDQTHTKEILEELLDKEKRARLWDIYHGRKGEKKVKIDEGESARIRNIEKQLENLNRNRRMTNENIFPMIPSMNTVNRLKSLQLRRRSSLDQQKFKRNLELDDSTKNNEQIPWSTKKTMIRRYFRRQTKKPTGLVAQNSTNSETLTNFAEDINRLTIVSREDDQQSDSLVDNERENPYLTYFYNPKTKTNIRPNVFDATFFNPADAK